MTFTPEFFKTNRKRLLETATPNVIVLAANCLMQKNAEEAFPFRQDSSFWYFSGIDVPDAILVMARSPHQEFVMLPPRAAHRDQWEGAIDSARLARESGIDTVLSYKEGWQRIKDLLESSETVGTLLPPSRKFYEFYGVHASPSRKLLMTALRRAKPKIEFDNIRETVKMLRLIKTGLRNRRSS